jgi:hypothetical protein
MISKIGADSIADEKFPQKKNPKQEAEGRYGKLHDFNCSGEMRTGVGWSGVEKEGGGGIPEAASGRAEAKRSAPEGSTSSSCLSSAAVKRTSWQAATGILINQIWLTLARAVDRSAARQLLRLIYDGRMGAMGFLD